MILLSSYLLYRTLPTALTNQESREAAFRLSEAKQLCETAKPARQLRSSEFCFLLIVLRT